MGYVGLYFLDLFLVTQEKLSHMINLGLLLENRHAPHMKFNINFKILSFYGFLANLTSPLFSWIYFWSVNFKTLSFHGFIANPMSPLFPWIYFWSIKKLMRIRHGPYAE